MNKKKSTQQVDSLPEILKTRAVTMDAKSSPEKVETKTQTKALPEDVNAGFVYVNDSVFFSQYSVG